MKLNLLGRVDVRDPRGPRFAWSGAGFTGRFTGPSVRIVLAELPKPGAEHWPNRYRVELDGEVTDALAGPAEFVFQRTALSPGEHTLTVVRQSEPLVGACQLVVAEANWVDPPARLARRLDVIGDSISTAFGIEGENEHAPFSSATENHWASYCAIAAREVGAELHTLAWSGRGVCRNRGNDPTELTMPALWTRALPEDATSVVVPERAPDAVLVLLGGNDFAEEDPETRFTDAYRELVQAIRAQFPAAHIFCALGAEFHDDYSGARTLVRGYLESVVKELGDPRATYFEFSERPEGDGSGSLHHPTGVTHRRMAGEWVEELRRTLKW